MHANKVTSIVCADSAKNLVPALKYQVSQRKNWAQIDKDSPLLKHQ